MSHWFVPAARTVCERQPMCVSLGRPNAAARTDSQQGPVYQMVGDIDTYIFVVIVIYLFYFVVRMGLPYKKLSFFFFWWEMHA